MVRQVFQAGVLLIGLWAALPLSGQSGRDYSSAQEVKAALVHKFLPFVGWPDSDRERSTVRIGVVGNRAMAETMKQLEAYRVGGRGLAVERVGVGIGGEDAGRYGILFISVRDRAERRALLERLSGRPVLTIGDTPGFIDEGGMIGFRVKEQRVVFEINLMTLQRAGLSLRSKLIRLAERVLRDPEPASSGRTEP